MAMTVTGAVTANGMMMAVEVITGTGLGTGHTATNTAADSLAINPLSTGSMVFGAQYLHTSFAGAGIPLTVFDANTTIISDVGANASGAGSYGGTIRLTGTTTASTPVTLGLNTGGTDADQSIALLEVSGSGLAIDASTPAPTPTSGAGGTKFSTGSYTTASFSPPVGAWLVVAIAVENTSSTVTVTDSTGGSYTWTEQVSATWSAGFGGVSVWTGTPSGGTSATAGLATATGADPAAAAPGLGLAPALGLASALGLTVASTAISLTAARAQAAGSAQSAFPPALIIQGSSMSSVGEAASCAGGVTAGYSSVSSVS